MHQNILLSYTNYFFNKFQCTYLAKQRIFTMAFLDSGATCTSLVSKSAHFVVLKTHKPHNIHTRFRNLQLSEQENTYDT